MIDGLTNITSFATNTYFFQDNFPFITSKLNIWSIMGEAHLSSQGHFSVKGYLLHPFFFILKKKISLG